MSLFPFGATPTHSFNLTPTELNFDDPSNRTGYFVNFPTTHASAPPAPSNGFCFGIPTTTWINLAGFGTPVATTRKRTLADFNVENASIRDAPIPVNILNATKELRAQIEAQKQISDQISCVSKIEYNEIKLFTDEIRNFECSLQETNTIHLKVLRNEISEAIVNVLMAQSIQNKSNDFPQENFPLKIFENEIAKYAQDLSIYHKHIEHTENLMRFIIKSQNISHEDLKRAFNEINKCLKTSTGRLQLMHQNVETLKAEYLNLRKNLLFDTKNVFEQLDETKSESENLIDKCRVTAGPNPFSNIFAIFGALNGS